MGKPSEQQLAYQVKLDKAITNELISLTPEGWTSAVLEVTQPQEPDGNSGPLHSIYSPDGHCDLVCPDHVLYGLTRDLFETISKRGRRLTSAVYTVNQLPDGDWRMKARYGYAPKPSTETDGSDGA